MGVLLVTRESEAPSQNISTSAKLTDIIVPLLGGVLALFALAFAAWRGWLRQKLRNRRRQRRRSQPPCSQTPSSSSVTASSTLGPRSIPLPERARTLDRQAPIPSPYPPSQRSSLSDLQRPSSVYSSHSYAPMLRNVRSPATDEASSTVLPDYASRLTEDTSPDYRSYDGSEPDGNARGSFMRG